LVYRSRFLPRILGAWLILNGITYVALSLTGLLWPHSENAVLHRAFPLLLGELAIMFWLLVVGAKKQLITAPA
jgi:Domain of unknown function (DUF4386)